MDVKALPLMVNIYTYPGSKTLAKYDIDGKLIKENKDPLSAIKRSQSHWRH